MKEYNKNDSTVNTLEAGAAGATTPQRYPWMQPQPTKPEIGLFNAILGVETPEALYESLRGIAVDGFKNMAMTLGMKAMDSLFEMEVTDLCGPKGKHDKERTATRHGTDQTRVVCGGEKRTIQSPRVRATDGSGEIPLETLAYFQNADQFGEEIFTHVMHGITTRRYEKVEGSGDESKSISKSNVSVIFAKEVEKQANEFFARKIEGDYISMMVDGIYVGGMTAMVALGIDTDGHKRILGLRTGGSENHEVVEELFRDLINRGLDATAKRLYVIDGGSALPKAIHSVFGSDAAIQRCQVHKKRNVLDHLPETQKAFIGLQISHAYMEFDYDEAKTRLEKIADNLEFRYPNAASSLREGLEETLTVHRLGVPGKLRVTLSNTNPIESSNSNARSFLKRVKRWRDGEMILNHTAAAFVQAEASFRRITGYREIPFLIEALRPATDKLNEATTA